MENVLAELKLAELKKDSLRKTLDTLQSQSSSLLRLTVQGKDLQDHFNSIEKLIQRHSEEFESKEKHFDLDRKSVDERSREVELKEEKLESVRKWVEEQPDSVRKWKEERAEVVEAGEKRLDSIRKSLEKRSEEVESRTSQLELERKTVLESVRELELKEKKFELLQRSLEERSQEVETKVKALDLVRKWIEDCSKEVELKGKELESKRKLVEELSDSVRKWMEGVELKEKQLDLRQKSIEEGSEELQSKKNQFELEQKAIQEGVQALEFKEKKFELFQRSLEERCQEVKLKEKRVDSVQKSVEGHCRELEWKEEKFETFQRLVEERSEEVESKAKWLDSKQNLIEERSKEIELKEKSLDSIRKSIEERSKEVELKEERLGMNEKSIEERCQELRMQEKQIDAMQKSVENRFEKLDLKGKEFNSMEVSTIEKSIEEGCIEVELKEKQLNSIQNLIEECSKEFTSKERQPDSITEGVEELRLQEKPCSKSIQFSVKENFKELELKERELKLIRERMEKCQGDLELKEKQFDSVKKSIEDCLEELKSKEKQLESIQKLFEERSKDLELKEKQFESIQKSIEECDKELKQKEKVVASIQNSIEQGSNNTQSQVMSKPLEDLPVHNAVDCSSSGDLRVCITMNGKSLQLFLNKRLNEHESMRSGVSSALRMSSDAAKLVLDAMQGFYPPHSKEGDVEFEASVIRRSCILLLEQLMSVAPQINPNMKEEAVKLAGEWRAKMRVETHNSWEVLGFLQLLATYGVASAFDAHDLLHLLGTVAQHRKVPELRRVLALADKIPAVHILHSQVKIERPEYVPANNPIASSYADVQPEYVPANNSIGSSCANIQPEYVPANNPIGSSYANVQFCDTMDGTNTQLVLSDHLGEHILEYGEVLATLQMSLDPAKEVLDALQGFYPPLLKKGVPDFRSSTLWKCILLLEQLMSISPEIEPHVKEQAMKLAVKWKAKMRVETENSLEVFVFLQILATYGLVTDFNGDEILKLLVIVAHHRQTPNLCRALGFAIPDVIELLIEKQQWLEAIRYSFAFELVDMFPPLPLLEAQLKCCKEVTKEIYLKGNPTHIVLAEVAEKESPVLRAVIKCIADYKLESVYSPVVLETRILQLEKHKADSRRTAPAPAQMALPQQQIGNKRPWTVVSAQDAPNANFGNAPAIHLVQPPSWHPAGLMNPGAKYSRTSAGQRGPLSPHMSSLHGPHALTPTPSIIKPPHISFSSWLFGSDIGTNGGARQSGFAGTHPGGAANLGAPQYELASTSGRWRWFTTTAPSSFPS